MGFLNGRSVDRRNENPETVFSNELSNQLRIINYESGRGVHSLVGRPRSLFTLFGPLLHQRDVSAEDLALLGIYILRFYIDCHVAVIHCI